MIEYILDSQGTFFLYVLLGSFFFVASWESLWPRRKPVVSTPRRWLVNLGLLFINIFGLRWLVPLGYLGAALLAQRQDWGLFHLLALPEAANLVLSLLLFDFFRYLVHRLLHAVPLFWRFHAAHHSDPDYDLTIGFRFHPLEAVVTWYLTLALIFLLGPSVLAIVVIETLQGFINVYAHGNVKMPQRLDWWLRLVLVTPDMHRVHHSTKRNETDSNFGNFFSLWDRGLGSYLARPHRPLEQLSIGLDSVPASDAMNLWDLLLRPFRARPAAVERER